MAYSELIKNFNRIREYMRDFYVYGFKNRDEFTQKSARSYDDERRRLESWLGDYMKFHHTVDGKIFFYLLIAGFPDIIHYIMRGKQRVLLMVISHCILY